MKLSIWTQTLILSLTQYLPVHTICISEMGDWSWDSDRQGGGGG